MSIARENRYAIFPVLATAYSLLAVTAANLRMAGHVHNFAAASLIAVVIGLLAWLASGIFTRGQDRRVLVALLLVAWFAGYGVLADLFLNLGVSRTTTFVIITAFLPILIAFTLRTRRNVENFAQTARVAVIILLLFPLGSFANSWRKLHETENRTYPHIRPPPVAESPNIFLIVLDKFTGSRSLIENYGYDNEGFETNLRSLGFVVPSKARSNYPHTRMTLASMLNWTHVHDLPQDTNSPTIALNNAIEDNRVWQFLRERGYEFVFFPTPFSGTRHNRLADRILPSEARRFGVNVGAAWLSSTTLGSILRTRAITSLFSVRDGAPFPFESASLIEEKFRLIEELAREPGPIFVFAHLLVPHEPYLFNADCSHRAAYWPPTDYLPDQRRIRKAYIEQVACVSAMVETLVKSMLDLSPAPPIILLQSDHGHGLISLDPLRGDQLPIERLDPSQIIERFDVFAAYYLPRTGSSVIYDSITPVNLFPSVFNYYFGSDFQLVGDESYWGRLHPPYGLVRIDWSDYMNTADNSGRSGDRIF